MTLLQNSTSLNIVQLHKCTNIHKETTFTNNMPSGTDETLITAQFQLWWSTPSVAPSTLHRPSPSQRTEPQLQESCPDVWSSMTTSVCLSECTTHRKAAAVEKWHRMTEGHINDKYEQYILHDAQICPCNLVSKQVPVNSWFCSSPYSLNCHGGAMVGFNRIALSSRVHKTESQSAVGHAQSESLKVPKERRRQNTLHIIFTAENPFIVILLYYYK